MCHLPFPAAPVVFAPNPVGQLLITNGDNGVRLLLQTSGPVAEAIMVFGQAPCNSGRTKRRNLAYLGLLPAPQDGLADLTDLYLARYGEPPPNTKVFIVTRQQHDGWESFDSVTSARVPPPPSTALATAQPELPLTVHMHKGCTPAAQGEGPPPSPDFLQGWESVTGDREAAKAALSGYELAGGGSGDPATPR